MGYSMLLTAPPPHPHPHPSPLSHLGKYEVSIPSHPNPWIILHPPPLPPPLRPHLPPPAPASFPLDPPLPRLFPVPSPPPLYIHPSTPLASLIKSESSAVYIIVVDSWSIALRTEPSQSTKRGSQEQCTIFLE